MAGLDLPAYHQSSNPQYCQPAMTPSPAATAIATVSTTILLPILPQITAAELINAFSVCLIDRYTFLWIRSADGLFRSN